MKPGVYMALLILSFVGIIVTFVLFILSVVSGSFFNDDSAFGIMLNIFIFMGAITAFTLLMVFFLIKYAKSKSNSYYAEPTKKCISCGQELGMTELSCPRCFVLQPPGGSSPSFFKRKR